MSGLFSAAFRRRRFFLKLLVGIPVLWFSFIGFTVVFLGRSEFVQQRSDVHLDSSKTNARTNKPSAVVIDPGANQPPLAGANEEHRPLPPHHHPAVHQQPLNPVIDSPDKLRFRQRLIEEAERKMEIERNPFVNVGGKKREERLRAPNKSPETDPKKVPSGPGEMGKGIEIKKENLSPAERAKFDDGWQKNAFNQYASDMMSVHRSLPDVRDSECLTRTYRSVLPLASVIICFHNEAKTILQRTVHSVLDRSPPQFIKEIILVDDFSDMPHTKQELSDYMDKLGKVKIVRSKKREGLIRGRLLGAAAATGDALIFLDSHCECAKGWLEPLLDRIADNISHVVTPVIDVIDDSTLRFQYSSASSTSVGGFDWNLQFSWHAIPQHERNRRKSIIDPVRSPTMAGGLFGMSRAYFNKLGTYDAGMDIWGGENLEISFRIWMCGGTLEILPCSHVGHIFRKRSPYSWKTGVNVVKKNSVRLAEVWMDEYKNYYYERFNYDLGEYGDVNDRKQLRKNLKCKSFKWFVDNIYPDLFVPGDAIASGAVRNKAMSQCLDSPADSKSHNQPVKMWPCHNQGGNQYWMLSKDGEIRRDESCMDYAGDKVIMYPCHSMKGNQEWVYAQDNTLRHKNTNLCMELTEDGKTLNMAMCNGGTRQVWFWRRKNEKN